MRIIGWLSCATIVLGGCATTGGAGDSGQGMTVRSNSSPVGVRILDLESNSEIAVGTTPLTLRRQGSGLFRGGQYLVTVRKPGAPQKTFNLKLPTVNFGGLLGWIIVDTESGQLWRLPQERSGLAWVGAPGEETFERITGFVIATLEDVKASPRAVAEMQLLPMKAR